MSIARPIHQDAGQKSRACIPCHDRKVRCNASLAGLPCSRCIKSGRSAQCELVYSSRSTTRVRRREGTFSRETRNQQKQASPRRQPLPAPGGSNGLDGRDVAQNARHDAARSLPGTPIHPCNSLRTGKAASVPSDGVDGAERTDSDVETVLEEDFQLSICRKIAGWGDDHSTKSTPSQVGCPTKSREILEYHDGVNSTTILGEFFCRNKPRRFVKIMLRESVSGEQGESNNVEAANMDILRRRGALVFPPQEICEQLLHIYFERVHPYTPVLDRIAFLRRFSERTYSHFLLQCILTSVTPFVPSHLISAMGYADRSSAQRSCFFKAQLLYDLEVEKSQLCLLQGSLMLTSSDFAFVRDKDCRFWLTNAVRLATQMGLHRKQIANQLDRPTRKLFTRLFWILYNKDVLMAIAGRANVRRLNDNDFDVPGLMEEDWEDSGDIERFEHLISPITRLQKLYLMHNTRLSQIGARFIATFRLPNARPAKSAYEDLEQRIYQWRKQLPPQLHSEVVEHWTNENIWILVLKAMSYRLECVFYRNLRDLYASEEHTSKQRAVQKQQNAMLELYLILDRIMLHDLVSFCPLSITTCASTVIAMHIEATLNPASSGSKRPASWTHIHNGLAYLRESSKYWDCTQCTLRMLEEIVSRTGLSLDRLDCFKVESSSANPFTPKQDRGSDGRSVSNSNLMGAFNVVAADQTSSHRPEPACTGFPHQTAPQMANSDSMYETMMDEDTEKWLNELLAENVLGMDNVDNMPSWGESGS